MSYANIFYFGIAGFMLVTLPFVPRILTLRILVLRKVHCYRVTDWHESNRDRLVLFARIIMPTIALILFLLGLSQ